MKTNYCIFDKWSKCWAIVMNSTLIAVAVLVGYLMGC